MDKLIGFYVDAGAVVLFDPVRMTHRNGVQPELIGDEESLTSDLRSENMITMDMGGDGYYSVRIVDASPISAVGRVMKSVGPFALKVESGTVFVGDLSFVGTVERRPPPPSWWNRLWGRVPSPPADQFIDVSPGRYFVHLQRVYPPGDLKQEGTIGDKNLLTADDVPTDFADVIITLTRADAESSASLTGLPSLVVDAN